jgi:acyl carrier protein
VDRQSILRHVKESIADSCGIAQDRIQPSSTLFQDLGITSIDMVDLLFTLESIFGLELKISDIERQCRAELHDEPFEVDGTITPEGRDALARLLPELPREALVDGLTMPNVIDLLNVDMLCTMIQHRLAEGSR